MERLTSLTDLEVAAWLRSLRSVPASDVARIESAHDRQRGPYAPHGSTTHHCYAESRH